MTPTGHLGILTADGGGQQLVVQGKRDCFSEVQVVRRPFPETEHDHIAACIVTHTGIHVFHTRDGGCHSGRDGTGIAVHGVNFAIAQGHDQSVIAVKGPERNLLYRHLAAQIGVAYGLVVAGLSILVQADKAVGAAADDSILPR